MFCCLFVSLSLLLLSYQFVYFFIAFIVPFRPKLTRHPCTPFLESFLSFPPFQRCPFYPASKRASVFVVFVFVFDFPALLSCFLPPSVFALLFCLGWSGHHQRRKKDDAEEHYDEDFKKERLPPAAGPYPPKQLTSTQKHPHDFPIVSYYVYAL